MKHCKTFTAGFTLVELLTVVAIIGILAAILIPAIGNVRYNARAAQGASNLRNMGTAFIAYAGDNSGYLPRPTIPKEEWNEKFPDDRVGGDQQWTKILRAYLPQQGGSKTAREHEIFVCPNAEYENKEGGLYSMDEIARTYTATEALYGINSGGRPDDEYSRPLASFFAPPKTILVIDAKAYKGSNGALSSTLWRYASGDQGKTAEGSTFIDFRQPGETANALYVDGHVSRVTIDEFAELDERNWHGRDE